MQINFHSAITRCQTSEDFFQIMANAKCEKKKDPELREYWIHSSFTHRIHWKIIREKLIELTEQSDDRETKRKFFLVGRDLIDTANYGVTIQNFEKQSNFANYILSECSNPNMFRNLSLGGVYLTTNEKRIQSTVDFLLKTEIPEGNKCHIGFSGWHNFDIMSIRKPEFGVICDFNDENRILIKKSLILLNKCTTRRLFADKIVKFFHNQIEFCICPNTKFGFDPDDEQIQVQRELTRKNSWLATDERFSYIKSLADKEAIAIITEDIREFKTFEILARILREFELKVDSLYLSNICKYMGTEADITNFKKSVFSLTQPKTIVINCPKNPDSTCVSPEQQTCLGEHLKLPNEIFG